MLKLRLVLTGICIFLVVLLLAMVITGILIMNPNRTQPAIQPKYLLVLGTTVNGTEPSPMLQDRINAAYEYLTADPEVIAIVSGYKNNAEISEAECMFRELTEMGIAPSRIWMEPKASSTIENFSFTLDLIEEKTGSRPNWLAVLSSEFHLLRASMFAAEQNIHIITVGAQTTDFPTFLYYFIREIFLVWYYAIF